MPYTPSQHHLFCACAADPKLAKKHGLTTTEARRLCEEGVKKQRVVEALAKKR